MKPRPFFVSGPAPGSPGGGGPRTGPAGGESGKADEPAAEEPSRRALLVSPAFPPSQEMGALRWQKFALHFHRRGWALDVVTRRPGDLPASDPGRLEELPEGTRVFGVRSPGVPGQRLERWLARGAGALRSALHRGRRGLHRLLGGATREPDGRGPDGPSPTPSSQHRRTILSRSFELRDLYRIYRILLEYSAGRRWARRAGRLASKLVDDTPYDAVITCGPPQMSHLAGVRLAREAGLPFVMDMRDPWSLAERLSGAHSHRLWFRLAARYERRSVREAALVSVATEPLAEAMRREHPEAADRIVTVMNGFDAGEGDGFDTAGRGAPDRADPFLVVYAGSIYGDRDPRPFFRAAGALVRELGLAPDEFQVEFMGHVDTFQGVPVPALARDAGLGAHFRARGFLPRDEASRRMGQAAVLLSLPQDSHLCIPGKVFEYMRFRAWMLVMAEPESATARLMADTRAHVVRPGDTAGIERALRGMLESFREGGAPERTVGEPRMSRAAQAERLIDALESKLPG